MTTTSKSHLTLIGGGYCRTIKAQYAKNGKANFKEQGAHGATGVIEYER